MSLTVKPMYGGAMEMAVPTTFVDSSQFRQIPDHQEVWVDMDSSQSVILEILEHVEQEGEAAIRYHFEEVGKANGCGAEEMRVTEVRALRESDLPKFNGRGITGHCLRGEQIAGKFNEEKKNIVYIEMALVRLPAPASADLLLSLNTPTLCAPGSSESEFAKATHSYFPQISASLGVNNWGLFCP